MAIALHHSKASGASLVVLLGIANHEGDGGSWPSVGTLAKYAKVTPRAVQKAIGHLEALGEIRRYVQAGGDHRVAPHARPNRYDVTLRCPITCDRTTKHKTIEGLEDPVNPSSPGELGFTRPVNPSSPKPSFNHPNTQVEKETHVGNRENTGKAVCGHDVNPGTDRCYLACQHEFELRNAS